MHYTFEQSNLPFKLEPAMVEYLTKVINAIPDDESTAFITMTPEPILGQPCYEFVISLHQPFDSQWQLLKLEVNIIEKDNKTVIPLGTVSRFNHWVLINDDLTVSTESGHQQSILWQPKILKDIATILMS